jgi:uncharacterized membrane protein YqhA
MMKGLAMQRARTVVEQVLWSSRILVVLAVVFSIVLSLLVFVTTTIDVLRLVGLLADYVNPSYSDARRSALQEQVIAGTVKALDAYLLGAIVLVFAFGLYELFIGKLEVIERSTVGRQLLLISSIDDLKERIAKVVILLLVILFFQEALHLAYARSSDLLFLGLGLLCAAAAVLLSGLKIGREH